MLEKCLKSLLVLAFSLFLTIFANNSFGQPKEQQEPAKNVVEELNIKEVIFDHIMDNHEFHFTDYKGSDGKIHTIAIPLPIILYTPGKGFSFFMSSAFDGGKNVVDGFKIEEGKIVSESGAAFYDLSLTRNVTQMILALALLVWLMISVAKIYKTGAGIKTAPKGKQNLVEILVMFVRDEIARPNLGYKVDKYLPFLLTVFFFILINNIFGLIPGSANVTGNIAFTIVLGLIAFVVIMFSTKKHYWIHIIWPPGVPFLVKLILIPVEIASIFIKPAALIIRLFANMVAGHIIIVSLISLIFIFAKMNHTIGWGSSVVSIAFTVFIYFIEVLVAFLQAFIFSILTAVFIGQAFEGDHSHDDYPVAADAVIH